MDSVNTIIENCIKELEVIIPPCIRINKELENELPVIMLDQDEIAIVIKNILENAVNAIKDCGALTITTRLVQLLPDNNEHVTIEIADTGRGIAPGEIHQVFEPFFSHCEGGTGLGLTLAKKISNGTMTQLKRSDSKDIYFSFIINSKTPILKL